MIGIVVDHINEAKGKLREMYKKKPNIEGLIDAIMGQLQPIEEALNGIATKTSIYDAEGVQLDLLGLLLDLERQGFTDELYRIRLLARIAQNVSKGTGEDIINVYKLLMRARYVQLEENYPAGVKVTAVGANQIGDISDIKAATKGAALGGVSLDTFAVVGNVPFCFADDTDPLGQGWGDLNDPSVGGEWNSFV